MSRSHYSDDYGEDFPGQLDLYRANVDRAFASRAGRARLAELLAALDAMPVKELYADVFVEKREAGETSLPDGAMCALGAWAAQSLGEGRAAGLFTESEPDSLDMAKRLKVLGWPELVVHDIVFENDEPRAKRVEVEGPHTSPYGYYSGWSDGRNPVIYHVDETPTDRWSRVREWVARRMREQAEADARVAAWKVKHPYTTPSPGGVGLL